MTTMRHHFSYDVSYDIGFPDPGRPHFVMVPDLISRILTAPICSRKYSLLMSARSTPLVALSVALANCIWSIPDLKAPRETNCFQQNVLTIHILTPINKDTDQDK